MDDSVVSRIAHDCYAEAPSIMPSTPWWNNLESTFHRRPEGFDLSLVDKLRVGGTAAFDIAVRTAGAAMLCATAIPLGYHPLKLRRMLREGNFYARFAERGDASAFFHEPPKNVGILRAPARWPYFTAEDCICEDLRFRSPFRPVNPRLREAYGKKRANQMAHARYWRHRSGPRPTIVAIHGFGADQYWLNERLFALRWFFTRLKCDVLLYTLPFHGLRQNRTSPFSGHGFFAGGMGWTNEAAAQAIYDFRIFFNHLTEDLGVPRVGVTGISLGGYTTAILAVAEPRLFFAIPNVPIASLADLILEWFPLSRAVRAYLAMTRRSVKDLRRMFAAHSPLTYPPALPRERLMIIGGVGDRLAPPKHSRLLWDHWGRCNIHWYPGSHIIHLDRETYLREMARFINRIGFLSG